MPNSWQDEPETSIVIAGLGAPSFVIVAAALSLTIAALAAQTEPPAVAAPAAQKMQMAPLRAATPLPDNAHHDDGDHGRATARAADAF